MPLRTEIKAIAESLPGSKTYIFGTAKEINNVMDSKPTDLYVCHFPFSPIIIEPSVNGSMDNSFELNVSFLYNTKFEKSSEDDETLVNQALLMANTFLARLRDYKAAPDTTNYFIIPKGSQPRAMPCYDVYDTNTCGVNLTFKVKLTKDPYLLNC